MTERPVRKEFTGWRDRALSERHRTWGHDLSMVDLDWIVVEYYQHQVMGLIDYKRETVPDWPPNPRNPNLLAIAGLADKAKTPFFVVRYDTRLNWYEPWCFSYWAHHGWSAYHKRRLTELEWVTFLYKLRARPVPPPVLARLQGKAA